MINDGANKGAWRRQLRDRLGKWVEMYGPVKFDIQIPGVKNKSIGYGIFIGSDRYGWSKIRVDDDKYIPKGVYEIENKYITGVKAVIGLDVSKSKATEQPKAKPLLKEITGEQALVEIKKSIAKYTKSQGRFPIARNQNDVTQAAKTQYQSIFPQMKAEYPELMSKYKTPEEFWEGIKVYGLRTNDRWANSVDDIDPMNKALNKVYARDILGLDPENGLITYYRNSINHHNDLATAAAGYLSLDSRMAWDYNSYLSKYPNSLTPFDGRYKVKVKPSEVIGLIGFSNMQDEYAVVVGPDVTSLPNRAERVGDLEIQKPTDWIDDSNTFDRTNGGSPWRNFSTLSNFDYYPLESDPLPGESFSDFRTGLGLPDDAISKKYQELYGKDINEALSKAGMRGGLYQGLQSMFIKFKGQDGKDYWGLDPRVLDQRYRYRGGGNIEVAEDDGYDVAIKVLSTIQELIGKPFMVNRGHDMSDPRLEDAPNVLPAVEPTVEEKDSTNSNFKDLAKEMNSWKPTNEIPEPARNGGGMTAKTWWAWEVGPDGNQYIDYMRQQACALTGLPVPTTDYDPGGSSAFYLERGWGAPNQNAIAGMVNSIERSGKQPELWRGVSVKDEEYAALLANLKSGDVMDMPLVSTSRSLGVAQWYANERTTGEPVLMRIEAGANGTSPGEKSYYKTDYETVINGKFEVVSNDIVETSYWSRASVSIEGGPGQFGRYDADRNWVPNENPVGWVGPNSANEPDNATVYEIYKYARDGGTDFSRFDTDKTKYTINAASPGFKNNRITLHQWDVKEPRGMRIITLRQKEVYKVENK